MNLDLTAEGPIAPESDDTATLPPAPSILEAFREAIAGKVERPSIIRAVPDRPAIKLQFSTKLQSPEFIGILRRAEEIVKPKGFTIPVGIVAACLGLVHQSEGILLNGDALSDDGRQLTLRDKAVYKDLLEGSEPHARIDAVRKLYGGAEYLSDYAISRQWGEIVTAAGITGESGEAAEDSEDPTS